MICCFFKLCIIYVNCSVSPTGDLVDEPSPEGLKMQEEVSNATGGYFEVFGEYIDDSQNPEKCKSFRKVLGNQISKNEAIIRAGCLEYPLVQNTQGAINEDKEWLKELDC